MCMFKICLVLATLLGHADPHGYLYVPPQRSTMWRHGFDTPKNYDDNGLNCGGFARQFSERNGGKCGVCGDPYDATSKPNEAGGKYATGTIAGTYQSGGDIKAEVMITSNHNGYFEFRLCPHIYPNTPVNQSCLNQNLLQVDDGSNLRTRYRLRSTRRGIYSVTLHLPSGVTCSRCVLQWTYTAGNNWGCNNTDCGVGKGPRQEHFVNCADIEISSRGPQQHTQAPPATPAPTPRPTNAPTTARPITTQATVRPTQAPTATNVNNCRAVGIWAALPKMKPWCETNCAVGFCPASRCFCGPTPTSTLSRLRCVGVGPLRVVPGINRWCNTNCNHEPANCPPTYCRCL